MFWKGPMPEPSPWLTENSVLPNLTTPTRHTKAHSWKRLGRES